MAGSLPAIFLVAHLASAYSGLMVRSAAKQRVSNPEAASSVETAAFAASSG
jgi:hypothetical protein